MTRKSKTYPTLRSDDAPGPQLVRLSQVQPTAIEFLWPGRIPKGKLTMIVGDPDVGKSLVTLDIAARISKGAMWPDGRTQKDSGAGDVVLLSAEDTVNDVIRPRLDAMGADPERVYILEADCGFNLGKDVEKLRSILGQLPNPRLVVIDPVSAYLGRSDSHNNAEMRAVLAPLCALAAETGVAIVCITHLNKGAGTPLQRIMGSIAFGAVARAVWIILRSPDDPETRYMLSVKNNLSPDRDSFGLSYTVESRGPFKAPAVVWGASPVKLSAIEALATEQAPRGRPASPRVEAERWLRAELADGPKLATEIEKKAAAEGISSTTLKRAKERLRIVSFRRPGGTGPWYWEMPGGCDDLPAFGQSKRAA